MEKRRSVMQSKGLDWREGKGWMMKILGYNRVENSLAAVTFCSSPAWIQ
jgi:hypothetical protein